MKSFEKLVPFLATFSGVAIFLYSVAFVVLAKTNPVWSGVLSPLFLMLFGILSSGAWVGLYMRLRENDNGFANWIVILAVLGAMGAAVHGAYDFSNALNPPASLNADLPSQIDPRGFLTFGISGLALLLGSLLMSTNKRMPKNLGSLGYLAGLLSIFLYLARLIVVDATSMVIVVPALVNGFIVGPVWYGWLGRALKK